jgi:hypothetical protein
MPDKISIREILFIPNTDLTYDFNTTDVHDNIRVPLRDDAKLSHALSLMSERTKLFNSVPAIDTYLPQYVAQQIDQLNRQIQRLFDDVIQPAPIFKSPHKVGPNALCPCGNGKKYKKCHGKN